ncbi:MAG: hypothetical protein ACOY3P_12260 [Planctomycetota bacterium]
MVRLAASPSGLDIGEGENSAEIDRAHAHKALRDREQRAVTGMTGHGAKSPHLAVEMMKLGANDYVTKAFAIEGRTLDRAIQNALRAGGRAKSKQKEPPQAATAGTLVRFDGGELVFHINRVELCGAVVLRGRCLMRRVLEALRRKQANGRYVAIGGKQLGEMLGVLRGQNAIAEAVKDFRDTVTAALRNQGINCRRDDVIRSGGPGYRLAEWIVVRDAE